MWNKIITGQAGSGRTGYILDEVKRNNLAYVECGNKIDDIRQIQEQTIALAHPTVFHIVNADNLTFAAQNSLLKILEEPPKNCHIYMEVTYMTNILPTLICRCEVVRIRQFSYNELRHIVEQEDIRVRDIDMLIRVAKTPGRLKQLHKEFEATYDFAERVYSCIATTSIGNAYKICNHIKLTSKGKGYDLTLFLECMKEIALDDRQPERYRATNKLLNNINQRGILPKIAFDCWVLDMRKIG